MFEKKKDPLLFPDFPWTVLLSFSSLFWQLYYLEHSVFPVAADVSSEINV